MKKLIIVMAFVFGGFVVSNAQTANTESKTETATVVSTDEAKASTEKTESKSKAHCAPSTKKACSSKKSCCSKAKAVKED